MNDPMNWNAKTGFPLSGAVVACHSGGNLPREWCDEYGCWLYTNELILKSDTGRFLKVTVHEIYPQRNDAAHGERKETR